MIVVCCYVFVCLFFYSSFFLDMPAMRMNLDDLSLTMSCLLSESSISLLLYKKVVF